MKKSLLIIFLLSIMYSGFGQTTIESVSGVYEFRIDATNGLFIDTLTLNPDGTFSFHEYGRIDQRLSPEGNTYGKGTWTIDKKIITFFTTTSDFDETHTLDFNNSKARFISKSPRDTSSRDIKTSMKFYESEISWMPKRTFIKAE